MGINITREQRRKRLSQRDFEISIAKSEIEISKCITRPATPEEVKMTGRKTTLKEVREHKRHYRPEPLLQRS